jgi:hypothetical protein
MTGEWGRESRPISDSLYICVRVCRRAITLLREDSVARLLGSLPRSARYILSRSSPCFSTLTIVLGPKCSKSCITHSTLDGVHVAERRFTFLSC